MKRPARLSYIYVRAPAIISAMAVSYQQNGDRIDFTNKDGKWSIWTATTYNADQTSRIGPGYIGKFVLPNGKVIADDFQSVENVLNDPRRGGLGAVGWHNGRRNGETNVYNRTWDLTVRGDAKKNGFGVCATRITDGPRKVTNEDAVKFTIDVDLSDGYSYPNPIMRVTYDYKFEESDVKQWITFTSVWDQSGPALFVKEPKIVCSINPNYTGGSRYQKMNLYDRVNNLLASRDLLSIPNPDVKTQQFGHNKRCRVNFLNEVNGLQPFNIIAETSPGSYSSIRVNWQDAPYGLDKWAQDANELEVFENSGGAYCTQGPGGTLTRQWELTKRQSEWNTDIMFHAWEGGSGFPDCLRVYRAWPAYGQQYTAYLNYSYGSGWLV